MAHWAYMIIITKMYFHKIFRGKGSNVSPIKINYNRIFNNLNACLNIFKLYSIHRIYSHRIISSRFSIKMINFSTFIYKSHPTIFISFILLYQNASFITPSNTLKNIIPPLPFLLYLNGQS